jgi:transcriptional regulator with XRE-family HTH domain
MGKLNLKLKIALVEQGLTQADLARGIGRSPAHVCRIIRGLARPRARDRKRIATFLGIQEGELFHLHYRRQIEPITSENVRFESHRTHCCPKSISKEKTK